MNSPISQRLGRTISTVLALSILISIPLYAQDEQPLDESELVLEEVIVTGTRLTIEDGFGRTSPVTVVGMEDISSYGLTRVEDVLNNLPQIETSENAFYSWSTGTASINLRGLGSKRTLVLFNSRRIQPGGILTTSVDVNQIPSAMIERVEVLTGGASATYGADAVAGVVNFIMRRVTGIEVSAGISAYQHDNRNSYIQKLMDKQDYVYPTGNSGFDGKTYNVDIVIGGDFDNGAGNATAYATWRKNEELKQEARDYSSCALNGAGVRCGGSQNAVVPNFYIAPIVDGEMDWYQYGFLTLAPDSSLIESVDNKYNYAPINHFMRPDERWSLGAFVDYEINEHAIAYLETNYASDRTAAQVAESGTFYVEQYDLPLSNSVFPDAFRDSLAAIWPGYDEFGIYFAKRNVEGGPRINNFEHDAFRIVAGLKGAINDAWGYDVSYLYGSTSSGDVYINDFFAPSIAQAVNGDLCAADPSCIPYEVFTYEGVTHEQANNLTGVAVMDGTTSTQVVNGYVTGDLGFSLPGSDDTIMVVAGFEFREEKFERISDDIFEQGLLLGMGAEPTPSLAGEYSVNELFAEANIPLLADRAFARKMTLDLAYRWSDYSNFGRTDTYRAGLVWQTLDWLRVRAGYNRAVRVPNTFELNRLRQMLSLGPGEPCSGPEPVYTLEQCARTGVTASQYGHIIQHPAGDFINALYGGNPDLEPEKADTYTFGLVIDPTDAMQISFDYWDIRIADVIDLADDLMIIEQCGFYGLLCERIHRADNGSLWMGRGYVDATDINLSETYFSGIDAAFGWSHDAFGGNFNVDMIGTYMLKRETTLVPNDPNSSHDCAGLISVRCYPAPKWRHNASATFDSHSFWVITGRWRYYGGVKYENIIKEFVYDEIAGDNTGAQSYIDLNAVFRFMDAHDVVVGINNVFDKEPPLLGSTLSTGANTIAGYYDTLGRYLFANVTLRW